MLKVTQKITVNAGLGKLIINNMNNNAIIDKMTMKALVFLRIVSLPICMSTQSCAAVLCQYFLYCFFLQMQYMFSSISSQVWGIGTRYFVHAWAVNIVNISQYNTNFMSAIYVAWWSESVSLPSQRQKFY